MDERCIGATVKDTVTSELVCSVLNVYGPAQSEDRFPFLEGFLKSPLANLLTEDLTCFFLGDFNLKTAALSTSCHDVRFKDWYDWVSLHFSNCFPDGNYTFQRDDTRSTIDYIFGNISTMSRVANCQQTYLPVHGRIISFSRWIFCPIVKISALASGGLIAICFRMILSQVY